MLLAKITTADILVIIGIIVALILAGLYFLNKWASKRVANQQSLIDKSKQQASIFVIDKKHDKAANVNLPKAVSENIPKTYKFVKMYFITAKLGPSVVTLICDKKIFNYIQPKKTYKIDIAGIYIVSVKGMKTEYELKKIAADKKSIEKAEKKAGKKD